MPDENAPEQPKQAEKSEHKRTYEGLVEERIAQAIADGLFSNLPGQGKPQRLDDDALVPEGDRAGYRLLKASGFALPWIEARNDLDEQRTALAAWLADANKRWEHASEQRRATIRAEYHGKLRDLQSAILLFNLRAPAGVPQLRGLRMDEERKKLGAK